MKRCGCGSQTHFIISEESKEYIKKRVLPLFSEAEQEELREMGKKFEALIKCPTEHGEATEK